MEIISATNLGMLNLLALFKRVFIARRQDINLDLLRVLDSRFRSSICEIVRLENISGELLSIKPIFVYRNLYKNICHIMHEKKWRVYILCVEALEGYELDDMCSNPGQDCLHFTKLINLEKMFFPLWVNSGADWAL